MDRPENEVNEEASPVKDVAVLAEMGITNQMHA
jgi:hypothetical protein